MIYEIGLLCLICLAVQVLLTLYRLFLRPINLAKYKRKDSWVAVTGASDGIGLGFVKVLAKHGFNVLLISRSEEKLQKVISDLQSEFKGRKFDHVVSHAEHLQVDVIRERMTGRDMAILVNNVGIGQGVHDKLCNLDPSHLQKMINVNCTFPLLLTQALMKQMIDRKHPGAIINIASVSSLTACPYNTTYSATKAFNRYFSLSLTGECAPSNIDVLTVHPGFVESQMTKMKKSLIVCTAEECAEGSLRQLGLVEVLPHYKHVVMMGALHLFIHSLIPIQWQPILMSRIFKQSALKRYGKAIID